MRDQWLTLLEEIHFHGLSVRKNLINRSIIRHPSALDRQGPVSFHQRQRRAETLVSQFQLAEHRARIVNIAEYSRQKGLNSNCLACQPVVWPGRRRETER